jgi:alkanesulfonate monooxygenase SsuD/methylene tetrahydromethanopterin reductase-like flavin-dependent oxidoreductase (luciferase family)
MTTSPAYPELGFYTLAGAPRSPRDMLDELSLAEELGLGTAFISERFNMKEAGALTGAALTRLATVIAGPRWCGTSERQMSS